MDSLNQKSKIKNQKLLSLWDIGKRNWVTFTLLVVILASFLLMVFSSRSDSMVVDEKVHISAGYLHVWKGNYTFNSEHPPLLNDLAGLFAKLGNPKLPVVDLHQFQADDQWEYGDLFFYGASNNVDRIVFWARFPFILLTLGLIYLCFVWAKTLFGPKAGLLAAALIAFEPNILAHGHLATTDIGLVFFFLLALWLWRKYYLKPGWQNALYLGLGMGLAILSKFSGVFILPIIFIALLYYYIFKKPKMASAILELLIILVSGFLLIWLVYFFSLRGDLGNGFWLGLPMNKFIEGWRILADHNQTGHWNYLNGQVNSIGWWYYFFYCLLYKLTIPMLILIFLAIFLGRYNFGGDGFMEEFLVIFPPLLFLGLATTSRIDIGIRHILPILPFLVIFISRLTTGKFLAAKTIVAGLVILAIYASVSVFPNFLAYFNEIAGGAKGGINHLVDSNLDWNQSMKRFAKYYQANNFDKVYEYCWDGQSFGYYGMNAEFLPTSPVSGVVVVCAHQFKLYQAYGYDISWVEKFPPDAIVDHTMYVWRYDLKNPL